MSAFQRSVFASGACGLALIRVGKCWNTWWSPFSLESLTLFCPQYADLLVFRLVDTTASVTTEGGIGPAVRSLIASFSAEGVFSTLRQRRFSKKSSSNFGMVSISSPSSTGFPQAGVVPDRWGHLLMRPRREERNCICCA